MDLFKNTLEPSYFKKVGSDLVYPRVFDYSTPIFVLNPSIWSTANGQITSKTQLDSEKIQFTDDLQIIAADFADSVWTSNDYYFGMGAATGGSTDNHILKSLSLNFL